MQWTHLMLGGSCRWIWNSCHKCWWENRREREDGVREMMSLVLLNSKGWTTLDRGVQKRANHSCLKLRQGAEVRGHPNGRDCRNGGSSPGRSGKARCHFSTNKIAILLLSQAHLLWNRLNCYHIPAFPYRSYTPLPSTGSIPLLCLKGSGNSRGLT